MSEEFKKRLKSFVWRFLGAFIIFALSWLTNNIDSLGLPIIITGILSLALGEITKWYNNRQKSFGKTFFGRAL